MMCLRCTRRVHAVKTNLEIKSEYGVAYDTADVVLVSEEDTNKIERESSGKVAEERRQP